MKVLYRLKQSGYEAYLVGGCVRDLLLGYEPKDFDVVTDASPEQVNHVFRNCRLIGRRFRLAHIYFGREIIEVATFRGFDQSDTDGHRVHEDGRLLRDNIYGSIEDDAWRRDFTVNSLYYNIRDFSIVDYTGGMQDHEQGLLRLIGDPEVRFREDPVRMIRAIRFAVKLGFSLEKNCEQSLFELAHLLKAIPAARLYDEVLKLFLSGKGLQTFEMLRHYALFEVLFPQTNACLAIEAHDFPKVFITRGLENSDRRIAEGKSVTPYFLLAVFLWEPLKSLAEEKMQQGEVESFAYQHAANEVLSSQVKTTSIPRRVSQSMREVWLLQLLFRHRSGARPFRLLKHPRFRAAYDFLLLRAETGSADKALADWWTTFQVAEEEQQKKMTRSQKNKKRRPKKNTRSRNKKQETQGDAE